MRLSNFYSLLFILFISSAPFSCSDKEKGVYPKTKDDDKERPIEKAVSHRDIDRGSNPGDVIDKQPDERKILIEKDKVAEDRGMIKVSAGTYQMGFMPAYGAYGGEKGEKTTVEAFWIDKNEVTAEAYEECVTEKKCKEPSAALKTCIWANRSKRKKHPINCVNWYQAVDFCSWKGKRLPSEEEWEYAARGTDGRMYPWGNEHASNLHRAYDKDNPETPGPARYKLCWTGDKTDKAGNYPNSTCPVGRYPDGASAFGILDMAGNVAEWTSQCGQEPMIKGRIDNYSRVSPDKCFVRGGGWIYESALDMKDLDGEMGDIRVVSRLPIPKSEQATDIGFRCARDAKD